MNTLAYTQEVGAPNPEHKTAADELLDLVPALYQDYSDTISALRRTNPEAELLGVTLNETTGRLSIVTDKIMEETVEEPYSVSVPKFRVQRKYTHNPGISITPTIDENKTVAYEVAISSNNVTREDLGIPGTVVDLGPNSGYTFLRVLVNPEKQTVDVDTRLKEYRNSPQKALELTKELVAAGFPDTRPKQSA